MSSTASQHQELFAAPQSRSPARSLASEAGAGRNAASSQLKRRLSSSQPHQLGAGQHKQSSASQDVGGAPTKRRRRSADRRARRAVGEPAAGSARVASPEQPADAHRLAGAPLDHERAEPAGQPQPDATTTKSTMSTISNMANNTTTTSNNNTTNNANNNTNKLHASKEAANKPNICGACLKPIRERFLLAALDKHWHEDCLKCACCDCRLGEVGSSLFTKSGKILCRRDYLRIFGQDGSCGVCGKSIPPYEFVMRAKKYAYHITCFKCQRCTYNFCVGDRFFVAGDSGQQVLCKLCQEDLAAGSALGAPPDAHEPAVGPPAGEQETPAPGQPSGKQPDGGQALEVAVHAAVAPPPPPPRTPPPPKNPAAPVVPAGCAT